MNDRILSILIDHAKRSPKIFRVQMTAALGRRGELLRHTISNNSLKTHPFQRQYARHPDAIHLHAEVAAIAKAKHILDDLSDCELYVARVKNDNGVLVPGNARPCRGCWECIAAFNIKRVHYTGAY